MLPNDWPMVRLGAAARRLGIEGLCALVGLSGAACSGASTPRRAIEMQPIGTVPPVERGAEEPGKGDVTAPNSATPVAIKEDACTGNDVDLDEAFKSCEVPMPKKGEVPNGIAYKLEIRVAPPTVPVAPGSSVDIQLFLRNKTAEPLALHFTGNPSPTVEIEALDAKGKRADAPSGKPPAAPKGAKRAREPKAFKITLGGNGTARMKVAWEAVKTKWAPALAKSWEGPGSPRAPAGPLPAGRYTLRFLVPVMGEIDPPTAPVEIGGGSGAAHSAPRDLPPGRVSHRT